MRLAAPPPLRTETRKGGHVTPSREKRREQKRGSDEPNMPTGPPAGAGLWYDQQRQIPVTHSTNAARRRQERLIVPALRSLGYRMLAICGAWKLIACLSLLGPPEQGFTQETEASFIACRGHILLGSLLQSVCARMPDSTVQFCLQRVYSGIQFEPRILRRSYLFRGVHCWHGGLRLLRAAASSSTRTFRGFQPLATIQCVGS